MEVDGNVVTFVVDGARLATVTDNKHLTGGLTGIISVGCEFKISSFTISRLH